MTVCSPFQKQKPGKLPIVVSGAVLGAVLAVVLGTVLRIILGIVLRAVLRIVLRIVLGAIVLAVFAVFHVSSLHIAKPYLLRNYYLHFSGFYSLCFKKEWSCYFSAFFV